MAQILLFPLEFVLNVLRFKPALNLNRILRDLRRGLNSLNSDTDYLLLPRHTNIFSTLMWWDKGLNHHCESDSDIFIKDIFSDICLEDMRGIDHFPQNPKFLISIFATKRCNCKRLIFLTFNILKKQYHVAKILLE